MTDTPPASASIPTPPAAPPRRPWTFLGRLTRAVREQNWFAVALEVVIVVVGVVVGFQVTAWGAERADAAKEQGYLEQISADLAETERTMTEADAGALGIERAIYLLERAFYTPERPPRDSLLRWVGNAAFGAPRRPVLGTVEALVATGDLALIRTDSLRSALTEYLEDAREEIDVQARFEQTRASAEERLRRHVDFSVPIMAVLPPDRIESALGVPLEGTAYFEGPRRSPLPLDVGRFLSDGDARHAAEQLVLGTQNLRRGRARMRQDAATLRALVDADLDR
ncbi:hypothetical protein [Rubrivirga sp. IMCC43871]|uniref:hypothetical protein n=1 Tax=Rubrivirga sp. IMCC43871 TaxID=3391575 RepID=UPI0039901F70